jgi:hypothetical protein
MSAQEFNRIRQPVGGALAGRLAFDPKLKVLWPVVLAVAVLVVYVLAFGERAAENLFHDYPVLGQPAAVDDVAELGHVPLGRSALVEKVPVAFLTAEARSPSGYVALHSGESLLAEFAGGCLTVLGLLGLVPAILGTRRDAVQGRKALEHRAAVGAVLVVGNRASDPGFSGVNADRHGLTSLGYVVWIAFVKKAAIRAKSLI